MTTPAARCTAVLAELRVRNLLLIESAELALDPGLNVITGETGAGKTMLAHALDLLLGGKPRRGIVRPGADEAYVEGVFEPPPGLASDPELAELAERVPLDADELVLARRAVPDGPTRSYMQGRSVSAGELRLVAARMLAFFGQHEHRKLMLASAQLEILDAFCGSAHLAARERFAAALAHARTLGRELEDLRARIGGRERDLDFLDFEIAEIEAVAPSADEETELERERSRLGAVESLRDAAAAAAEALDPQDGAGDDGVLARMAGAGAALERAAGADEELAAMASRCGSLTVELQDLGGELRAYLDTLEADPERLAAVAERLDQLGRLKRKHGGSIAAVLAHAQQCRAERERLAGAEEATGRLERELDAATAELQAAARKLHATRAKAAGRLAERVVSELGDLALADAVFEVVVSERAITPAGTDAVEFLIGPNPGVPPGPLRETASGGELSRVMLALLGVATAGGSGTVVFDEVDAGIGGATARAVGERLRALAAARQVVCITHLPQVASLADRHFRVSKRTRLRDAAEPQVATTDVARLGRAELVEELCRMLGADGADEAARRHAEKLLQAA
jgi:DNA repair protein RecN (Recombination protein N)